MSKPTTPPVRSADVQAALRDRYTAPEWAVLFEVPSATGGAAARRADAIAMSLWPSRGLEIHGFEIKVERRDWLRELKEPQKAEEIARFCDRWWIAAAPDVVKLDELPRGWGLLILRDATLRQVVEAPLREGVVPTRPFLASMLRAAATASPAEEAIRGAVERARGEERKIARTSADALRSGAERDLERLQKAVDDFEAASGVRISAYGGGKEMGAAVKLVLDGGFAMRRGRVQALADLLRGIVRDCDAALAVDIGDTDVTPPG